MCSQQINFGNKINSSATNYVNIIVLILCVFYLFINYDVLRDLYYKWYPRNSTGAYSYGLLVAVISLYLIYKKIQSIKTELKIKPSITGFALLASSQTMLFASDISHVNFLQHICLVVSLLALVWALYSYRIAKEFFLPAILFSLTLPVWGDAALPLQKISVFLTSILLGVTGIPYYHQQEFFHFPNGIIEIAPGCSGLEQVLVSLIIGLIFSAQYKLRIIDTIKTLIYITFAAILINSIRILIVMIIGYFTKMESSLVSQHALLGWVIYGIGIYTFLFFYSRRNFKTAISTSLQNTNRQTFYFSKGQNFRLLAIATILVIIPSMLVIFITNIINSRTIQPVRYTLTSSEWKKTSSSLNIDWIPDYPAADSQVTGEYTGANKTIFLYVMKYVRMQEGVEAVNMENKPFNPKRWSYYRHENILIRNIEDKTSQVEFYRLVTKYNEHLDVLSFYVINGRVTDSLVMAKLATLFGLLKLKHDITVVCIAIKSQSENDDTGKAALLDFYKHLKVNN